MPDTSPPTRVPTLVALVAVLVLVAVALIASWAVFAPAGNDDAVRPTRFVVRSVTVELDGEVVRLYGTAPSDEATQELVDALFARDDIAVVISALVADATAPAVAISTIDTTIDIARETGN
ncbi:MAG: hypothetical protein RIB98_07360 [Acidimicrobiales bacterium]